MTDAIKINITPDPTAIEALSERVREEAFSAKRYFTVALITSALGAGILPFCYPVAVVFFVASAWYLWSAIIIEANLDAENRYLEKPIRQLHAMAMEVNSGVAAAGLFPLTFSNQYHSAKGDLKGRPILMVNGYLSFGSTWDYQRQRLVQEGLGPIYTINIGSGRSIKTYAKHVQDKVAQIQKETGRNDLILIGHSKGGLVCSYYATHLADAATKITDVITIGSPLAGTPLAYLGAGYDAAEMRSRAEFHRKLRQKMEENSQIRFSHIASEVDGVVPLSSALLGDNHSRQLILKDMGHLGLVFSSRVADQVCTWLKE